MAIRTSLFQFAKYFMTFCGLWKVPFSPKVQRFYVVFSNVSHFVYCSFVLSLFVKALLIVVGFESSDNVFNAISVAVIMFDINFKAMIYVKFGLPRLFHQLMKEEQSIEENSHQEISEYYLRQCELYVNICTLQLVTTIFPTYFYILVNILQFPLDAENFMYEMWIPFPVQWKVLAIFKIVICQYGIFMNTAVRSALQSLMMFITSQLWILQVNIRNVFSEFSEEAAREELGKLIRKHQFLIGFVEKVNDSVKYILLLEYLLDSINMAAAMLQIATASSVTEMTFTLVYFILLLTQLVILAWSANEINTQSVEVSNAIYQSNWMDQNKSIKTTLLIMLIRAQKPLGLTIGPFRFMNLEASLMTMKASYTYSRVMTETYA
ncbi:hypothetical protein HUJ04_011957 [Dendroctonus ponderosae]|uniref:Odorant receptor n=1 Tax=Dendroctonus ponderosae TaxID=77166 RepID=A0AAR5PXY3_DENPD|nr:hypothetical protein HUJ04_011957 [Dendroctonus ponderosae]